MFGIAGCWNDHSKIAGAVGMCMQIRISTMPPLGVEMTQNKRWPDRRCCDWEVFLSGLMRSAERLNFPLLLINWCEARRWWRQYACTGHEVVLMQRGREMQDALYNGYGEPPIGGGNGSGDGGTPRTPQPIKPLTFV
jgi:hypothetical protein